MVQIERPNYDREGRDNVEKTFANALTLVSLSQQLVIKQSFIPASSNIFPSMPDVVIPTPLGACDNEFQDILDCLLGFRRSDEFCLFDMLSDPHMSISIPYCHCYPLQGCLESPLVSYNWNNILDEHLEVFNVFSNRYLAA